MAPPGLTALSQLLLSRLLLVGLLLSLALLAACGRTEPKEEYKKSDQASDASAVGDNSAQRTQQLLDKLSRDKKQSAEHGGNAYCQGLVSHNERVRIAKFAKPPFMQYYRDPAFGSKVIRITDSALGQVNKPVYSTMQAWNADESLLLLYRTGGQQNGHYLHDGKTYQLIRKLDIKPKDLEEVFWSYKEPDYFYYVSRAKDDKRGWFIKANAVSGEKTRVRHFEEQCGNAVPTAGNDVQMHSLDDDVFGFRCGSDDQYTAFTYRVSTDEVSSMKIGKGTRWPSRYAPAVAPSGQRSQIAQQVFGPAFGEPQLKLDFAKVEHGSIGRTWDGQDAYYQTSFESNENGCSGDMWKGLGHLIEYNTATGQCRPIVDQGDGYSYTTRGTHVSATAWQAPNLVAMSSIGYGSFKHFEDDTLAPALLSEVYVVNTHPEEKLVCRLAQHRSFGKAAKNGGYKPYFGEPHATLSPSGTRVIFGSDWYDSGSVDAYVIELPTYQRQ